VRVSELERSLLELLPLLLALGSLHPESPSHPSLG
jgi:hypothetical protein